MVIDVTGINRKNDYLVESAADIGGIAVLAASIATGGFITIALGVGIYTTIKERKSVKNAISNYKKLHPDCIPISEFKRKLYKINPYSDDEAGEEFNSKEYKKVKSWIWKNEMNRICVFFDKNNKPRMLYSYRTSTTYGNNSSLTTQKIIAKMDKDLEKDRDYYTSCFLEYFNMYTKDLVAWAENINKEAKEKGLCK